MKPNKRIFNLKPLLSAVTICLFSTYSLAQADQEHFNGPQSSDDIQLENLLKAQLDEKAVPVQTKVFSMSEAIGQLQAFGAKAKASHCTDAKKVLFNYKYVMTSDSEGKPCRVYDLSFPNLKALMVSAQAMKVPVRPVTSGEYLSWIKGDTTALASRNNEFSRRINLRQVAQTSWVSRLKFRQRPVAVPGSQASPTEIGLPQSFALADLELGQNVKFDFDQNTKNQIQALIQDVNSRKDLDGTGASDILTAQTLDALKKPQDLLKKVKFNWNDLEKVYDVAIEGDFLPFSGPVTLIDFQTQYKFAVEKLIRSFLASGLIRLAQLVPDPTVSALIEVGVTDLFEQVELMYNYQMLQLESALRLQLNNSELNLEQQALYNRALNLLYGQQADLFTNYILSVAQGQAFNWTAFENMGRNSRYGIEKSREIMMSKLNSRLVQERNCKTSLVQNYFAVCVVNGEKEAIYSLISERSVFNKNLGAPMLYRYKRPYEAAALRGGAWFLSIGARVIGLPLSRPLTSTLSNQLKSYMRSGLLDEALLRSNLALQAQAGKTLTADGLSVMSWLYIQNLNPFTPKSLQSENKLIAINKQIIGLSPIQ
jgi:hypothetical protein